MIHTTSLFLVQPIFLPVEAVRQVIILSDQNLPTYKFVPVIITNFVSLTLGYIFQGVIFKAPNFSIIEIAIEAKIPKSGFSNI